MSRHTINTNERKVLRDINKVLNKDIRKYFAEVLTNSDDSYGRLEMANEISDKEIKQINIFVNRSKREVTVVDKAEGMSRKILEDFENYGADKSKSGNTSSVRGMFGQGATDVFFSAALNNLTSKIISIKDNIIHEVNFMLENNKDRVFSIEEIQDKLDYYRKKYNIDKNGTAIIFGIPQNVTFARFENLAASLNRYYMLRTLLSKSNREVTLIDEETNDKQRLTYDFEAFYKLEQIDKQTFSFKYKNKTIQGELDFRINKNKDIEEGIYIYEGNVALDSNFFDRKNNPGMQYLEGRIELTGAISSIRDELGLSLPEEIITDTRDGFNKNSDFFRLLKERIEISLISALAKAAGNEDDSSSSIKGEKEFNRIFSELNKLISEEIEEISPGGDIPTDLPPAEGLRFERPKIKITKGKKYAIKLMVNTDIIPEGSVIALENNHTNFVINESLLVVENIQNNPHRISIVIEAVEVTDTTIEVKAKYNNQFETSLLIDVIDKEIHYPKYGLEFFPSVLTKKPSIKSKAFLYIDSTKYPVGTMINFESSSPDINIENKTLLFEKSNLIASTSIGLITVIINGGDDGLDYSVTANVGKSNTKLLIKVRTKIDSDDLKSGYLNDIKKGKTMDFVETFYKSNEGHVIINENNAANVVFLQKWFETGKPNKLEKLYLANLVSIEMAKFSLKKKIEKGKIAELDNEEYFDELQKDKQKFFEVFYRNIRW